MDSLYFLVPIFFFIAMFYSMVGFGGGSSYLAVLALFGVDYRQLRLIALLCNTVVVSNNIFLFHKSHLLKLKKSLPILLFSMPAAYFGGSILLAKPLFYFILGIVLLIAGIFMLFDIELKSGQLQTNKYLFGAIAGGSIGFISGLMGIGGGIFLAPLLVLTKWDNAKVVAATSSLFILTNSVAGILGQLSNPNIIPKGQLLLFLALAVFAGGRIGATLTIKHLSAKQVKVITGLLLWIVSFRLLWNHLN